MTEPKGLHVRIEPELHKRLRIHSAETGRTMTELVEEALRDLLAKASK